MDFLQIFYETRVQLNRHVSPEEKNAVASEIKRLISEHKYSLHKNEKNFRFMQKTGFKKSDIMDIIQQYVQGKNIVGVIPNRNYPEQGSQELYLLKMYLKKYSVYVKVDVTEDKAEFWSIHDLTGSLDGDYQYACDFQENNLIKKHVRDWREKYNKVAPAGCKVISSYIVGNVAHFDFACGDVNYDNAGGFLSLFMSEEPHSLYQIRKINNHIQLDLNAGGIDVELEEK